MRKIIFTTFLLVFALAVSAQSAGKKMSNSELVKTALTELFIKKDINALEKYWSVEYIQHNPVAGNGRDALKKLLAPSLSNLKYEMGAIAENGDIVMVHGRYTGFGSKPMVAVDIFRIKDGKLAEHWDVMQEEVPSDKTVSKNSMLTPGK